jgi:hypothetical protein
MRNMQPRPYQFTDTMDRFDKSYDRVRGFRQDDAYQAAGNALTEGDYAGASKALYGEGLIKDGAAIEDRGADQQAAASKAALDQEARSAKVIADAMSNLRRLHDSETDPEKRKAKVLQGFDFYTPRFRALDESDDEIGQLRAQLEADPDTTLTLMGTEAAKAAGYELRAVGDEVVAIDPRTAKEVARFRSSKPIQLDPEKPIYVPEGAPPPAGGVAPVSGAGKPADIDAVWEAAKMQESGGRGDAVGPRTPYGQAFGSTQMLPATAEAMARKLGLPWNPALMRENSPRALEYQDKLGRAYFEEGLEKYGGDPEKALAYYHGGPNEQLWGPKTRAHVEAVMGRVTPTQIASNEPAPRVPGYRMASPGRPKAPEWVDLPGGGQRNVVTGKTDGVPKASGRLSATVIKMQTDLLTDLKVASVTNATLERVINQLDAGELDLGIAENLTSSARNMTGLSSPNSRNYASFRGTLEKMRNDSLRLNKGVQTEGDAVRAWKEIQANPNDEALVRMRLGEIKDLNEQAIALRKDLVNQARTDSGMEALDTSRYEARPVVNDPGKAGGKQLRKDPVAVREAAIAIRRGAPREKVIQRLRENGIDPAGI